MSTSAPPPPSSSWHFGCFSIFNSSLYIKDIILLSMSMLWGSQFSFDFFMYFMDMKTVKKCMQPNLFFLSLLLAFWVIIRKPFPMSRLKRNLSTFSSSTCMVSLFTPRFLIHLEFIYMVWDTDLIPSDYAAIPHSLLKSPPSLPVTCNTTSVYIGWISFTPNQLV